MSDLIIKGMDMPKSCADCFFRQAAPNSLDVYFCYADKNNRYAVHDKRPLFCPLVEIPTPHGRLIDADDIDNITVVCTNRGTLKRIDAPTIIEAEE